MSLFAPNLSFLGRVYFGTVCNTADEPWIIGALNSPNLAPWAAVQVDAIYSLLVVAEDFHKFFSSAGCYLSSYPIFKLSCLLYLQLRGDMCTSEMWTYQECGCQYLYEIPCSRSCGSLNHVSHAQLSPELNEDSTSSTISSSLRLTSACEECLQESETFSEVQGSQKDSITTDVNAGKANEQRAATGGLGSQRQTINRNFVEPICDECLLKEVGIKAGLDAVAGSMPGMEKPPGEKSEFLANWLLESHVEVTVEDPSLDFQDGIQSKQSEDDRDSNSVIVDETDEDTRHRGRAREDALRVAPGFRYSYKMSPINNRERSYPTSQRSRNVKSTANQIKSSYKLKSTPRIKEHRQARFSPSWSEQLKNGLGCHAHRARRKSGLRLPAVYRQQKYLADDTSSTASEEASPLACRREDPLFTLSAPSFPQNSSRSVDRGAQATTDPLASSGELRPSDLSNQSNTYDSKDKYGGALQVTEGSLGPSSNRVQPMQAFPMETQNCRTATSSFLSLRPSSSSSSSSSSLSSSFPTLSLVEQCKAWDGLSFYPPRTSSLPKAQA